jgi:hypothetical protein
VRVTVLGSWREAEAADWGLKDQALFAAACRHIGAAVVRQGHVLIAASDKEDTADFHAVEGALAALEGGPSAPPPIRLFGDRTKFIKWTTGALKWVTAEVSPEAEWKHAKLFQVKLSDCVIPIAGADGTFHAGFAAAVADKLVVPIGSFGGASARLVDLFSQTYERWARLPPKPLLGRLSYSWQDYLAEEIDKLIGVAAPRLVIIHGRSPHHQELDDFLHGELGLPQPVIMRNKFLPGATLPEKWEHLANNIDGAIALVTPDDVGGLADAADATASTEKRARENVWIEAGWVWGRLGRKRLLLLRQGDTRIPSDLLGSDLAEYLASPIEAKTTIRAFVESIRTAL